MYCTVLKSVAYNITPRGTELQRRCGAGQCVKAWCAVAWCSVVRFSAVQRCAWQAKDTIIDACKDCDKQQKQLCAQAHTWQTEALPARSLLILRQSCASTAPFGTQRCLCGEGHRDMHVEQQTCPMPQTQQSSTSEECPERISVHILTWLGSRRAQCHRSDNPAHLTNAQGESVSSACLSGGSMQMVIPGDNVDRAQACTCRQAHSTAVAHNPNQVSQTPTFFARETTGNSNLHTGT